MQKNITITNGSGTADILNGSYNVSVSSTGYDNTSITPSSVTVVDGTNEYNFTISANGTLTIHVSEDGTSSGTAVVGAKFIRTDSTGTTYGSEITTDDSGNAELLYLPYADTGAPTIYFKQTASDGAHEFSTNVLSTTLNTQTGIYEVTNTPAATRTFNLTDENYSNMPISSATITLNN